MHLRISSLSDLVARSLLAIQLPFISLSVLRLAVNVRVNTEIRARGSAPQGGALPSHRSLIRGSLGSPRKNQKPLLFNKPGGGRCARGIGRLRSSQPWGASASRCAAISSSFFGGSGELSAGACRTETERVVPDGVRSLAFQRLRSAGCHSGGGRGC